MLPRAVTSDEHTLIQKDGQWVELVACVPVPATVYTARVNGTPSGTDRIAELPFDGGAGTLADVLPGMTMFIGSSAGAYDKGQARIRKDPISGTFYIGEESELDVADNDFLTVIDEFLIWGRPPRIVSGLAQVDYDVAYTNQHAARVPVVVLGGPVVLEMLIEPVTARFDASGSWVPGGGSATYLWDAPTADSIDDDTAAAVAIVISTAGRHRVSCTVTIGGVANTRYEYVYVFDEGHPPTTQFQVRTVTCSKSEGGYNYQMTMFAEADQTAVRDRAQIILFTRDHFGAAGQQTIGYATGRENIFCTGWIAGETILWSAELGSVTFQIQGAHYWLEQVTAFAMGIEDVTAAPDRWTQYQNLTLTAMVWHLLVWRSTVAQVIDCIVEVDTRRAVDFQAAATSLWDQITIIAGQSILASPCTDHLSRLFVLIDSQYRENRSDIVEVMTLTTADWQAPIQINRITVPPTSLVDLSGVSFDGTNATALFSLAPGHVFGHFGHVQSVQALLLTDQSQANALAGLIAGQANNPYPSIPLQLAANNRFLDIAPDCYALLTLAASDNVRGLTFAAKRLIPRRITWNYDPASGGLLPSVDFEAESFAELAVTGDAPATEPVAPPEPPPDDSCPTGYHWDADLETCVTDGVGEGDGNTVYVLTADFLGRSRNFLDASPSWEDVTGALPGAMDQFDVDKFDPIHVGYVMSNVHGVFMTENLDASPPDWVLVISKSDIQTAVGETFLGIYSMSTSTQSPRGLGIGAGFTRASDSQQVSISIGFGASVSLGAVGFNWHEIANGSPGDTFDVKTYLQVSNWRSGLAWAIPCINNRFGGVYRYNDTLGEWELLEDLAPAFDELALGGDFALAGGNGTSGEKYMYAYSAGGGGKIWRNQNYGRTTPGTTGWTVVYDLGADLSAVSDRSIFGGHYFNVATLNELDVMVAVPHNDPGAQGLWLLRSTDGGDTWSSSFFVGTGIRDGKDLARWPYDPERVFFLADSGSLGSGGILYSEAGGTDLDDYANTDKTGDWATVFGTGFESPKTIIPIWISTE
jgi:hypothetical protein